MNYLVTVNGEDQKGLVEALATSVQSIGGNWLESRLCRLGGQFAGIVMVEFEQAPTALPETVGKLQCTWKLVNEQAPTAVAPGELATIKILAADRPGIIRQISHILVTLGANVEEIESHIKSAPFSGERMFEAIYRVNLENGANSDRLQEGLESLAEELMCDLEYQKS